MAAHRIVDSISISLYARNRPSKLILSWKSISTYNIQKYRNETRSSLFFSNKKITENGRKGKLYEAEQIFHQIPDKNVVSWTAMLSAYAHNGQLTKARELFDNMPQRTVASWNAMITAYIKNRVDVNEAFRMFLQMPERNVVSYGAMMSGLLEAGKFDKAEMLYIEMPASFRDPTCSNILMNGYLKKGKLDEAVRVFKAMSEKNVVTWSLIIDGYCKRGLANEARELFNMAKEKNVVTWGAMINGYMKLGSFEDGCRLFIQMRREGGIEDESNILTILFEACGRFCKYKEGIQAHGLLLRLGSECDVFLCNSIITMYSRFGCLDEAKTIFGSMLDRDVISWNSMIAAYVEAGKVEEAYEAFNSTPQKDVVTWTTMIIGFSSKGLTRKCVELFEKMPQRDSVAWTALISGFVNNGKYEDAIQLFIQMLRKGAKPEPITLSVVFCGSANLATLDLGVQIHALVVKMDMEYELCIQNSLINMYSKCGSLREAHRVFESIRSPNLVSFNSMITGFAQNGCGRQALELFANLKKYKQEPNEITFLGVLSSCTYIGLVDDAWDHFKSMTSLYKIEPGPDHYACMIDLLGRAGLFEKAVDLINSMPVEAHSGVWGALLDASRTHLRLDLAKLAAERISELEPDNAVPYVVLSDIYSFVGKKEDEERVRVVKKLNRIKKSPGCSWIMIKDSIHIFLSGDKSHRNFG